MYINNKIINGMMFNNKEVIEAKLNNKIVYKKKDNPVIDYIESITGNGTPYINTGIKANQDTSMELKMKPISIQAYRGIAGCRNTQYSFCFWTNNTEYRADYRNKNNVSLLLPNLEETMTMKLDKNNFYLTMPNGEEFNLINQFQYVPFDIEEPIYLFAVNDKGNKGNSLPLTLYYAKIWDNGNMVRNFKPCLDINGIVCLYDEISKEYYYNANSKGEFT